MGYAKGDTVVHPQHGTAVVEAIVTRDLGSGPTEYLELFVEDASMKISVPAEAVQQVGIRSVSSRREAKAILALLEETPDVPESWPDRNSATTARMKSRELDQIAMAVRDLMHHRRRIGKPLNLGEQSALDEGLSILAGELSLALGLSEEETLALLAEKGSGGVADSEALDTQAS